MFKSHVFFSSANAVRFDSVKLVMSKMNFLSQFLKKKKKQMVLFQRYYMELTHSHTMTLFDTPGKQAAPPAWLSGECGGLKTWWL